MDNCDTVIREEYNSFMKLDNDIDKKVVIVNKLSNNDLREYGYILKLVESGVFSSLEELCEMVHSIIITNDGYLSRAVFYSSDILFYEELKEDNPFLEESEFKVPKVSTLTVINREKLLEEKARSLPDIGKLIDILKVANVLDVSNAYKLTVF